MLDKEILFDCGATIKKYKSGDYIFREGERCLFYHQLMEGEVRVISETEEGKEFLHKIIFPGNCFGELPLFDHEPYAISAVAETKSEVIILSRDKFNSLLTEDKELYPLFTNFFTKRIRFEICRLKEIASIDPKYRISSLLNYFNEERNVCVGGNNTGIICSVCSKVKLTRQQIADMTGLRVETVIRTLKKMDEEGKVKIVKGKVFMNANSQKNSCINTED